MKKITLALMLLLTVAFSGLAADLGTVWSQLTKKDSFIVADATKDKASKNDFQTLTVALNSAPTSEQINEVRRLMSTINANQKVTSTVRDGVEVEVFAAPANADASLYKLMILIDKDGNPDKVLLVLYGTCTAQNLTNALQNLSIEDIIGG